MATEVTPLRPRVTGSILVEPGQPVHDAEWQHGYRAGHEVGAARTQLAYDKGCIAGRAHARRAARTTTVAVCSCAAFVAGFATAIGIFA